MGPAVWPELASCCQPGNNYVVLTAVVSITGSDGAAPAMGTTQSSVRACYACYACDRARSDGNSLHPGPATCRTRFDLIVDLALAIAPWDWLAALISENIRGLIAGSLDDLETVPR
jgi:hypothetical protein